MDLFHQRDMTLQQSATQSIKTLYKHLGTVKNCHEKLRKVMNKLRTSYEKVMKSYENYEKLRLSYKRVTKSYEKLQKVTNELSGSFKRCL